MGGPAPSVQFSRDGPGALGGGDDGKALCWDQSSGRFVLTAKAAAAHTHAPSDISQGGATSGQALIWDGAEWAPATLPAGVTDHGDLTGLADDDHAQYIVLAPGDSTRNVIQPTGAAIKPLVIKGATSQSANLLEWQNSAGTLLTYVSASGHLRAPSLEPVPSGSSTRTVWIGPGAWGGTVDGYSYGYASVKMIQWGSSAGAVIICAMAAGNVGLRVKAAASATANIISGEDSAGTVQFALGPAGQVKTNQTTANTNTPSGATARQLPLYNESGTLLGYVPVYGSAW